MFAELLAEWSMTKGAQEILGKHEESQDWALLDFAQWLDMRRPSPRPADRSAIELLRKIKGDLQFDGHRISESLVQEIDAVLKTAGGG